MAPRADPTAAPLGSESDEPWLDPAIEAYKKDVDRTLIRGLLKRTPEERLLTLERAVEDACELRKAMVAALAQSPAPPPRRFASR